MHFEVASVKSARPGQRGYSLRIQPGGAVSFHNATVMTVLTEAYGIHAFQVANAPGWLTDIRYDIDAKPPDSKAKRRDLLLMLQGLLADRFQLATHRETKEMAVYSLVPAKGGPKLDPPKDVTGPHGVDYRNGGTQLIGRNASMAEFADALSFRLERAVADRTGLGNGFDFKLEFSPDESVRRFGDDGPTVIEPDGISIFTAIQRQLGLKLESGRGPVDVIVIDRIERATEN
jgi:uncharacterized protein (TIGR03435 family)